MQAIYHLPSLSHVKRLEFKLNLGQVPQKLSSKTNRQVKLFNRSSSKVIDETTVIQNNEMWNGNHNIISHSSYPTTTLIVKVVLVIYFLKVKKQNDGGWAVLNWNILYQPSLYIE